MKRLRVLMLCHEELVPPASIDGLSDEEISDFRTEFDVLTAVRDLGHECEPAGTPDDVEALRTMLLDYRPDVCFNLLVEFHGAAHYDQHVASYLELMRLDYTGCNPRGLTLARDKALSKTVAAAAGVRVPAFQVFPAGRRIRRRADLEFPLFVKSLDEEASLGISVRSIVHDDEQLAERVEYFHDEVGSAAIAEEYIEGRELYVGLLGHERPKLFPAWELNIPNLPKGAPNIATRAVKWNVAHQRKIGVKNHRASGLPPTAERELQRFSRRTYEALGLSGYARLDFRLRPDGRVYLLEANPNPDLTYGEDFADSAEAAGLSYEDLLQRILRLGQRYPAGWKTAAGV
ncbi:MAG: D-alanine--D-alanine ligase [Planctomycetota bacterium]